jgi:hypothetical protein
MPHEPDLTPPLPSHDYQSHPSLQRDWSLEYAFNHVRLDDLRIGPAVIPPWEDLSALAQERTQFHGHGSNDNNCFSRQNAIRTPPRPYGNSINHNNVELSRIRQGVDVRTTVMSLTSLNGGNASDMHSDNASQHP